MFTIASRFILPWNFRARLYYTAASQPHVFARLLVGDNILYDNLRNNLFLSLNQPFFVLIKINCKTFFDVILNGVCLLALNIRVKTIPCDSKYDNCVSLK